MSLADTLIAPLLDDARRLADSGFAGRADIDTAMRLGAGHPHGPFELMGEPATPADPADDSEVSRPARVAVVGTGTMARGIAEVTARAGIPTTVVGRTSASAARAIESIADRLRRSVERGKLTAQAGADALACLRPADDLTVVGDCELVIEAVVEELAVKRDLFARLQGCAPQASLATNTSSFCVSEVSASVAHPDRVLALHFFNPAPAMRLVEVVAGAGTDQHLVSRGHAWARLLGKEPVSCGDEPGFLVNRLLVPYLNHAARVAPGSSEGWSATDAAVRSELGHPMGPFELMDLIGVDVMVFALETMHRGFGEERYVPSPVLCELIAQGRLGRKTGAGFYEYPRA
jgi:3-hydroxybutyryl-CoA dehydrogenase